MDPGPIFTIDTSSTVTVYLLQTTITFHTIQLILCFQQTNEIHNLTVCWGKVLSLCCVGFQVASNTFGSFPSSYWFDNLGFLLRSNLFLYSSYLPLGVSQRSSIVIWDASSCFMVPLPGRLRTSSLGESSTFFYLLCFFCLVLFASFQKTQKN